MFMTITMAIIVTVYGFWLAGLGGALASLFGYFFLWFVAMLVAERIFK